VIAVTLLMSPRDGVDRVDRRLLGEFLDLAEAPDAAPTIAMPPTIHSTERMMPAIAMPFPPATRDLAMPMMPVDDADDRCDDEAPDDAADQADQGRHVRARRAGDMG
jgi:hypothetical protein